MKYTGDRQLPLVTDQMLREAVATTRPFTTLILKAGPKYEMPGPERSPDVAKIVWEHGKPNYALHLAGLLPIVCAVADGSGVTGICVFDASPDDVMRILSEDPAVRAQLFTYEIRPTRTFPGSCLKSEEGSS